MQGQIYRTGTMGTAHFRSGKYSELILKKEMYAVKLLVFYLAILLITSLVASCTFN